MNFLASFLLKKLIFIGIAKQVSQQWGTVCSHRNAYHLSEKLSTKLSTYIIHKNSVILQVSLAVYLLSPFKGSLVKQPLFLPTLMWVYRVVQFLCLQALFMMLFIRDLSKSCGMEVYRVEKSNV